MHFMIKMVFFLVSAFMISVPALSDTAVKYNKELDESNLSELYNRYLFKRRATSAVNTSLGGALINGDFVNAQWKLNFRLGYKRYLNEHFNLNLNFNRFNLANENIFNQQFYAVDANMEYNLLPFDKLSPFVFAGAGTNVSNDFNKIHPKLFFGGGVEYLAISNLGISLFVDNNFVFSDDLDGEVRGKRDDMYLRAGVGLNFYLGNNDPKKQEERARKKELRRIKRENIEKSFYKETPKEKPVKSASKDNN